MQGQGGSRSGVLQWVVVLVVGVLVVTVVLGLNLIPRLERRAEGPERGQAGVHAGERSPAPAPASTSSPRTSTRRIRS